MNRTLKNGIIASIMVFVVVCLGTVAAEDVIVKQGTIGTGYPSPDPKAKMFISENASDVYREDCYGLLTVTTDSTNGTTNRYGAICEFFPAAGDTSSSYPGLGGGFFCDVVGTQAGDGRMYYGLYGGTAGKTNGYVINNKTVSLYGIAFDVENENDVVGPTPVGFRYYTTCAVLVNSKPVNDGYDMTGGLRFRNYGINVCAKLDGDFQPTVFGNGENYGIRIETSDQLDSPATKPIKSYALYLQPFASTANLGGGETWGLYQYGAGVNNRFDGNLVVGGIFDNTPGYSGTAQDALNEILNTKSIDGKIDHSSLPALARATLKRVEKTNVRIVEQTDPSGKIVEVEEYDTDVVEEEGRNLGAMITVLTEAVKGLNEKVEALAAENQILKAEIAALKATATTP